MRSHRDWLPIGSVVILKGYESKLMIYGRNQMRNGLEKFDYVACHYPQGNISSNYNVFFDKDQIEKVLFKGFIDEEERILRLQL